MTTIPQRTLGEALLLAAEKHPYKTAAICDGNKYKYGYLTKCALKLANFLVDLGIKKGDRVSVFLNNSIISFISLYGITLAGGVFVLINPLTKAGKLKYILNNSGSKILITENLLKEACSQITGGDVFSGIVLLSKGSSRSEIIFSDNPISFEDILSSKHKKINLPVVIPTDLAALIYTSGSTGFPKGVMMTHQSMVFTTWSLIEYLRLSDNDRIMLVLPLAFDYGLYQLLMAVTIAGTLIIEHSFTFPATIYNHIKKMKPTVFPGVPTIFALIIESYKKTGLSFDSVKKITNTAAALPNDYIPYLRKIFPGALIYIMYGLTECKRVCYLEPELIDQKPDSVGKAIPGTEVFIIDKDGNAVAPGEPGILHIRGPHIMAGYWNNKKLSDEMLRPGNIPGERILCSHDLFKMDDEGYLYFMGRTDDIIKSRGEKISPLEIEDTICKLSEVKEVAVIGMPDKILGEAIIAFVSAYKNTRIKEEEIMKVCKDNLELFMVPQRILLIDKMPKNHNGKIDKLQLKDMIRLQDNSSY